MSQPTLPAARVAALLGEFDRQPAYLGLAEGLRSLIGDGRIAVGVRLPSERDLTQALGVSRTTVARAYDELRQRGFLTSRQGSGNFAVIPRGRATRGDHLMLPGTRDDGIDLTCAAPTPTAGLLAVYQQAVADLPTHLLGTGYFPSGLPALRDAVAAHYVRRGLPTAADQIIVVPGALAGVAIAVRALARRGHSALLESPSYPNAIATVAQAGLRLRTSDVDPIDADPAALVESLRRHSPDLAYLIPDFQNPTGHLLGDHGRAAVAEELARQRTVAIIDETMASLVLDDVDLPAPFAHYDPRALTVGSLSKSFWGGLRVGWIRAPRDLVDDLVRARVALDLGVPVLEQVVGTTLLASGQSMLEQRRQDLRESRDAAVDALARHLPQWQVRVPAGGLTLWCRLPHPVSVELAGRASELGLHLAIGPDFAPLGGLSSHLRIPFTQPAPVLVTAIERLAEVTASLPDPGSVAGRRTAPRHGRASGTGPLVA